MVSREFLVRCRRHHGNRIAVICCGWLLFGVMAGSMAQDAGTVVASDASPAAVSFPDPAAAWLKQGSFVNLDNLRNVGPGQNKDQLYGLLGSPHFDEGFFGVRVWNYLFNLRQAGSLKQCQLQIQFDEKKLVKATYWREPACADIVRGNT